jgi:ubiquinone/menaquinone biosynthesis C-methylase UbiE
LYDLNYKSHVYIVFSPVVIDQMKVKHPDMEWKVMDVRDLTFQDSVFDLAIDKATLDAITVGS